MKPITNHDSILAICLFAAYSKGELCDADRDEISRYAQEMDSDNLAVISRRVLMGKLSLEEACNSLGSQQERLLAYEMARSISESKNSISNEKPEFLKDLRNRLILSKGDSCTANAEGNSPAFAPLGMTLSETIPTDTCSIILKYAILIGALELKPQTLAKVVMIPLQMKMLYRIGKAHGEELNPANIKEFLATAGISIGSQMVEGYARKLVGKLEGKATGKVADQVNGSAVSFASTYAIGHLAHNYYTNADKLTAPDYKKLAGTLQKQARELHSKYLPEIQERAKTLDSAAILSLVQGSTPV